MDHQMGETAFWDNNERAQKHIAKLNSLKRAVLPVVAFQKKVDDLGVMLELIEAALPPSRRTPALATLCGAVIDGLLLELLSTGDRRRTTDAITLFGALLHKR